MYIFFTFKTLSLVFRKICNFFSFIVFIARMGELRFNSRITTFDKEYMYVTECNKCYALFPNQRKIFPNLYIACTRNILKGFVVMLIVPT